MEEESDEETDIEMKDAENIDNNDDVEFPGGGRRGSATSENNKYKPDVPESPLKPGGEGSTENTGPPIELVEALKKIREILKTSYDRTEAVLDNTDMLSAEWMYRIQEKQMKNILL